MLNTAEFYGAVSNYRKNECLPTFEQLKSLARRSPFLRDAFREDLNVEPITLVEFHSKMLIWAFEGDDAECIRHGIPTFSDELASMIALAQTNSEAFDALCFFAAYCIEHGTQLDASLKAWLVQSLRGEIVRPKPQKGPFQFKNLNRDKCLIMHLSFIEMTGAKVTENDGTFGGQSACHSVNEALSGKVDVPSPKTLMNIWSNRSQNADLYKRYALLFLR